MQNEEKTANYIGEAVILLTADHLGIETEMLDTAKEVWRTKRLPDASLLGYYASAARKACEAVLAGGVSSRSNTLELFAPHLSCAQVANYCLENGIDVNSVVKLVYRENLDYIHAEPIVDRGRWYMFGGNYLKTSDSRFKDLTGIRYPVPVHDRTEESP